MVYYQTDCAADPGTTIDAEINKSHANRDLKSLLKNVQSIAIIAPMVHKFNLLNWLLNLDRLFSYSLGVKQVRVKMIIDYHYR